MMITGRFHKRGLYALTPAVDEPARVVDLAGRALAGGAAWLQYRGKPVPDPRIARDLRELCRRHGALFIVNDDPDLAAAVGADGVHLGRGDPAVEQARAILGARGVIGVSCYNDLERAGRLAAQGADYLAFGSVFPSATKPGAVHCPREVISSAGRFGLPVVAIGGITLDNAASVIEAGADVVAVASDLFEASDVEARAAEFAKLFGDSG